VIDESPGSFETAARLGELIDADRMEIHILHVQKPPVSMIKALWVDPGKARRIDMERRFQAEKIFMTVNAALARQGLMANHQSTIDGDPVEEILRVAGELNPAVIAMPMGSTAEKVLARSRHPVLVVHVGDETTTWRKAG
jgi:nucleotide-binding universal stress UspA family protein